MVSGQFGAGDGLAAGMIEPCRLPCFLLFQRLLVHPVGPVYERRCFTARAQIEQAIVIELPQPRRVQAIPGKLVGNPVNECHVGQDNLLFDFAIADSPESRTGLFGIGLRMAIMN